MSKNYLLYRDVKLNDLVFDDWKKYGGCTVTYGGDHLYIKTPWIKNAFGLQTFTNDKGINTYTANFSLDDKTPIVKEFKDFMVSLDNLLHEATLQMKENKNENLTWLSPIKPARNPKYPDTLRVKLKTIDDYFDLTIASNNGNENTASVGRLQNFLNHGSQYRCVIELLPLWKFSGRAGSTWKVVRIEKRQSSKYPYQK